MKKNKLFLGMALLALLCGISVTSCGEDDDNDDLTGGGGGNGEKETVVFTGSSSDITFHSAVLTCSIKEEEVFGLEYEVGIVYDTTTVSLVCGQADGSRRGFEIEPSVYRVELSSLSPATRYYYRSFIRINDKNYYGNIKSFVTVDFPEIDFTGFSSDITFHSAVLTCSIEDDDVFGSEYTVGVVYDTVSVASVSRFAKYTIGEEIESNIYQVQLSSLSSATCYYYRSFIHIDGKYYYGKSINSFITETFNGSRDYVDLGLPSGVKWATCNIGADSPEEYGDYYAWGETEPKETYTIDNSK